MSGSEVEIRNPNSTRPWQHVLDPLVGYIMAMENLLTDSTPSQFNFGPTEESLSVLKLIEEGKSIIPGIKFRILPLTGNCSQKETETLQLNSEKSNRELKWKSRWSSLESIQQTFKWWNSYLYYSGNPIDLSNNDIDEYFLKLNRSNA